MAIAFTAYAFEGKILNWEEAHKLGIIRSQSYRVAEKKVHESVRQPNGRSKQTGPIKRVRDDLYLVDCAVTGSSDGTADDPKFALSRLFENYIRVRVKKLVCPGGKFEGYQVVFQGDSAGPHIEEGYMRIIQQMCEEEGWWWENQAAQMPHMNVLDLSVFPDMSRRHCALARASGGLCVLKEDEIWEAAEQVWRDLPNCKIASAYCHAYRIGEEVVRQKGDNRFLGERSGISFGVRGEYHETATGVERRDGKRSPPTSHTD